jgi:putative heme transporter
VATDIADATGKGPSTMRRGGGRSFWEQLPWLVRWAVVWSGCLLVVAAGLYLLGVLAARLAPLTIAIAVTLFLAALLDPLVLALRRLRFPPTLAALTAVIVLLGSLAGAVALVWSLTADQFADLSQQLGQGLSRTREFVTSALPVSPEQLDRWTERAVSGLRQGGPDPVAAFSSAAQVAGAVLLVIVLLFFLLKDGRSMWAWCLNRSSERSRPAMADAGRAGWRTLGSYSRGTVIIATVDAVGIGLALVLLRVPLAFPLALITFLGGFVPIIGATVAGSVAVLVALAAKGPTTALLVLAAVIAVQQLEGNLLEPLIMKRQVRLHPVVILVAVTAGTLFGGVAGAFVAVPITAVLYRVIDTVAAHRQRPAAG